MPSYRLARGGPSPRSRLPWEVKATEGQRVYRLHVGARQSFRTIGAQLGVSATTAYRRFWWYQDAIVYPELRGTPREFVPPQRGTRECPRGEPPTLVRTTDRQVRHPLPAIRCTARRSNGKPCRRWAIRGGRVCPTHGGSAPQIRRAAAERVRVAVEMDRGLRERLRHQMAPASDGMRVRDLRAQVLAERRSWHP